MLYLLVVFYGKNSGENYVIFFFNEVGFYKSFFGFYFIGNIY